MGVYNRNKNHPGKKPNYWITYYAEGKQRHEPVGPDRRQAERLLRERKRAVAAGNWSPHMPTSMAPTLQAYSELWLKRRLDLATVEDDRARLRDHVLPALGGVRLDEIRPRQVRGVFEKIKLKGLAPRTIRNIYSTLKVLLRDAVADEHIVASPCVLPSGFLPAKRDKDPTWRKGAIYTRDERDELLFDLRNPFDRRTVYSLEFLAGLRFGEAAGRPWHDYHPEFKPLGKLIVDTQYDGDPTKTEVPREVPVHPVLATILEDWRTVGFPLLFGRPAEPHDLIVPSRRGRVRSVRHMHRKMQEDCKRLGMRPRRQHDARRTFISLARADGARQSVLKLITHGPPQGIMDLYSTLPWETLCEAVAVMKVTSS